ncbi:hypothetical protein RSOL_120700 [Rhizoctonia solani AG-3 Rhs1AP]|uniref:Uncharacterized protein n=2 Tax=Rhizoctonia solani AG-3 TaxID=1086053 RepID=A0A074S3F0_9AGAM|nr:hypothetical protein RSOL_120700 [Rhizoctonia solani AG-3 Rhs1AP]KEP51418.1 hypothetical protein V565_062180 [Rhizoctonia solani 123E]
MILMRLGLCPSKVGLSLGTLLCVPKNTVCFATVVTRGDRFAGKMPQKPSSQSTPKGLQDKLMQRRSQVYIKKFFAQYPKFNYDPANHYMDEFYRMTKQFGWDSKGTFEQRARFRAARDKIDKASVLQFNEIYGTDEGDPAAWQTLFDILRIGKAPKNVADCKRRARAFHTNLCDMIENHSRGEPVQRFKTKEELKEYTIKTGKFFPLEHAEAGGLLKFLLRHILSPPSPPHQQKVNDPIVKQVNRPSNCEILFKYFKPLQTLCKMIQDWYKRLVINLRV